MDESFWIMQGYEIYIWPSYVLTLLSLSLLFVHSTKQSQKAKKLLKQLSKTKMKQTLPKEVLAYLCVLKVNQVLK